VKLRFFPADGRGHCHMGSFTTLAVKRHNSGSSVWADFTSIDYTQLSTTLT